MAAEALASRADSLAVGTCLHVAPVYVESVRSLLSYTGLVCLKLCLRHHFTSIIGAYDGIILEIGLDVPCGILIHMQSFDHTVHKNELF